MKKLLLIICLGWSISALAQVDSYSGIGYTPRFVHSSAIMDMLHAYEKNFDSVITPFEEVKIMHGGALNSNLIMRPITEKLSIKTMILAALNLLFTIYPFYTNSII